MPLPAVRGLLRFGQDFGVGDCFRDGMHVRKMGVLAGSGNSMEFFITGEHERAITFQEIRRFHKVLPNIDSDGEFEFQVD